MRFYTNDNLPTGSSLERRGTRQVCHLVQKWAAWHLASSVPGLWNKTRQAASYHSNTPKARYLLRSHIHFQGRQKFSPLWKPSLQKLLAFCTAYLTQQTRDKRVLGKHFLFTSHRLSFAVTSRIEWVLSICQSSRDNLSGELLFRLLSNLGWQQSVGRASARKENQRLFCLCSHGISDDTE